MTAATPSRPRRPSPGHVLWAWAVHIWEWYEEGLSPGEIRKKLREEYELRVGTEAIRAVIAAGDPRV